MPVRAAEAALAGTYRCDAPIRERSYRQLVDIEVKKRRGTSEIFGPAGAARGELICNGPSGEYLRVFMAQTPAGEVVDKIDLTVPYARVDKAALVRQVDAKYGRPTAGSAANGSWCATSCGSDFTMEPGPRVTTMDMGSGLKILASRGMNARRADEAAVKAAADLEAPPANRGAF
jgi:hypothetical protein